MSFRSIMDREMRIMDGLRSTTGKRLGRFTKYWYDYPKVEMIKEERACYRNGGCPYFSEDKGCPSRSEFFPGNVIRKERTIFFCSMGQFPMTDNSNLVPSRCKMRTYCKKIMKKYKEKKKPHRLW